MDCDVAAAFDHVSQDEISKATLAMGVPPMLIAAWIRKYRNSETMVKLDHVVTPGIRRTRSVPQGEVQLWTHQLRGFVTCANTIMGTTCGKRVSSSSLFHGQLLGHRDVARRASNYGKSVERAVETMWTTN